MQFRCPICECSVYQRVVVPRVGGAPYETEFFHCLGCSVMFLEPELFAVSPAFRDEQRASAAGEVGPNSGAPSEALAAQTMRSRFWYDARADYAAAGSRPRTRLHACVIGTGSDRQRDRSAAPSARIVRLRGTYRAESLPRFVPQH